MPQSLAQLSTGRIQMAGSLSKNCQSRKRLKAYTMGSEYAEFEENEKGFITPGNWPIWFYSVMTS